MKKKEILIREWEKRYDSYIGYRNQYLNTLNISIIVIGVCISIAFGSDKISFSLTNLLMILAIIVLTGLFIAHVIVASFLKKFSKRISDIEKELGMYSYETIILLKHAVLVTKYVSLAGSISFTILLILYDLRIIII